MDGTGYPKGLNSTQMSASKIMAIADIYEALTAADRPYKDGKSRPGMRIMGFMKNDYHIDEDLLRSSLPLEFIKNIHLTT